MALVQILLLLGTLLLSICARIDLITILPLDDRQFLKAGENFSISCTLHGKIRNNKIIKQLTFLYGSDDNKTDLRSSTTKIVNELNSTTINLEIINPRREDGGNYYCCLRKKRKLCWKEVYFELKFGDAPAKPKLICTSYNIEKLVCDVDVVKSEEDLGGIPTTWNIAFKLNRARNIVVYEFVYQQTEFSTSMAMYPNATRGYMPFVATNKRAHGQNVAKKAVKGEKHNASAKQGDTKTYRVTLRDRNGFTYTYIIQADGSKSLPVLCESKVTGPNGFSSSLPNIAEAALTGRRLSLPSTSTSEKEGNKKGLFNSLLQYIRKKTKSPSSTNSASKSGKSKRKTKSMVHRKRQRTVSAMSNLDPIQESPEEDSEEDADSYTHSTGSDADSFGDNEP